MEVFEHATRLELQQDSSASGECGLRIGNISSNRTSHSLRASGCGDGASNASFVMCGIRSFVLLAILSFVVLVIRSFVLRVCIVLVVELIRAVQNQ